MHIALYERIWLGIAVVILILFLGVITVGAMVNIGNMPGMAEVVNPDTVATNDPRFANPRVEQVSPGEYEVYVVARMYSFSPREIEVPAGAQVTFYVTSPDVLHGFEIAGTNFNAMVTPGYVTRISGKFPKPGEYLILCNEYCGQGHQMMSAKVEVK